MRRALPGLGSTCALLLVVGCSSSQAGTPAPASVSMSSGAAPVEVGAPCELLSAADAAEVGLADGERLSELTCDWILDSAAGVRLDIVGDQSLADTPEQGTPVDIGDRRGDRLENPDGRTGACTVGLETSDTSFVLISATVGQDTAAACDLATEVAERVEPNLP
ncbi:MAG TPA: DUF3558 family protein [Actinophytocola sp.]|nr:DUF3558 family protein [Actinophytocola sp.]